MEAVYRTSVAATVQYLPGARNPVERHDTLCVVLSSDVVGSNPHMADYDGSRLRITGVQTSKITT